jgi:alpha-L-fucosidase 2
VTVTRRDFVQGAFAFGVLPQLQSAAKHPPAAPHELWYTSPAERWLEALPIGNGHLGGMVYGGVQTERIALSESTAWSGAPATGEVNPGARQHLDEIRNLFFQGKYDDAQALCQRYLPGHPKNFGTNLPLPELQFAFENLPAPTGYRRWLNLDSAVAQVLFHANGTSFQREFFASHPDKVLAIRMSASNAGQLSFRMSYERSIVPVKVSVAGDNTLVLDGHAWESLHSTGHDGVDFQIRTQVIAKGGHTTPTDNAVIVRDADEVIVLVAIGTSFGGADPKGTGEVLARASSRQFAQLRRTHSEDHQSLFRRVSIDLGRASRTTGSQPTDLRRKALEDGANDPELLALFFQYGRYLTIAGSRSDSSLPLALQGVWNDGLASSMGWTDDFHLDINTEQNYWAAEVCNLGECQAPLFGLIDVMQKSGRETARQMYGARGWVCHTVTNPWGYTAPGGIGWGVFVSAGIWISLQLWDRWKFGGDIELLRKRTYPVLREAAELFLSYMTREPKHNWLVTGPSDSPENWYITPSGGRAAESMGNTCDRALVHALYSICIEASETLSVDEDLREQLKAARASLPPFQIGRHGQLQEWLEDFEDADPNHRHTSHLVSLYPLHQISPHDTPELARAAEVTIQRRINTRNWEQSEWGRANLVAYYARLLKGDDAHNHLIGLLAKATDANLLAFSSGGVAGATQNVFAVDGNTAGTAGMAEMLLQSQDEEITLLPALPAAWPSGSVTGLCARGGFVLDIAWHDGKLTSANIFSRNGTSTQLRYGNRKAAVHLKRGEARRYSSNLSIA